MASHADRRGLRNIAVRGDLLGARVHAWFRLYFRRELDRKSLWGGEDAALERV